MSLSWVKIMATLRRRVSEEAVKPPPPPGLREEQAVEGKYQRLDEGQRASLMWMAERLPQQGGLVLADEVGSGKTRIACAVVHAVLEAGGRAAVVVPRGVMHQWVAESRKFQPGFPTAKGLTTVNRLLGVEVKDKTVWTDGSPCPDQPEWWLISHGFRAPLVRTHSAPWRVALPALVALHLASPAERQDARKWVGKLQRRLTHLEAQSGEWAGMARIAREIAPHVRYNADLRARIEQLPPLDASGSNNEKLIATFGKDGDGRPLTEQLLGLWLGAFDIIVIDEAPKSRGEVEAEDMVDGVVSGSVLSRLVNVILRQNAAGRRLCLTATPMELDLSQWLDLLARARCGLDGEVGRRVVKRLQDAASRAKVTPDESDSLETLCAAAKDFARTLAPYVTRRRRGADAVVAKFRAKAPVPNGAPHPHRQVRQVEIAWADTVGQNSPWLDVMFAAECMSRSALGLTLKDTEGWPRAVRDAYTKLSAGHVSKHINMDSVETSEPLRVPAPGEGDAHTRGKFARVAYWYRRLQDGRRRVIAEFPEVAGAEFDPDAEHPRILAAVKEIEQWTLAGEKVLVFGVFLAPLRLLQDVLNIRHALRMADAGRPNSRAVDTNPRLHGIALRQLGRLRAEGALTGRLQHADGAETRIALQESHADYERLRRRVRERADSPLPRWRSDPTLLAGAPDDAELDGLILDHLIAFILDDVLATNTEGGEVTRARMDTLSDSFIEEQLRPLLSELDENDMDEAQMRRRLEPIKAILKGDDVRQHSHARLLQGSVKPQARRLLQAAFNRPGTSPWVVIAQSQVGREGLNLHEACRVVVQFHAEWNPAVLEQQIGRVDRKGSLWERRAQAWMDAGAQGEPPYVEVRQLIFEGTYDAFQWDRVRHRQHSFDASLFGALLPAEAWERIPEARRDEVRAAAPSFDPAAFSDPAAAAWRRQGSSG